MRPSSWSREVLVLRGRDPPAVPLRFVEHGDRIFVFAVGSKSRWEDAADSESPARADLPGAPDSLYRLHRIQDRAAEVAILQRFIEKYGAELVRQYLSGSRRLIALDRIAVTSDSGAPGAVFQEFESIATAYDEAVESDPFGKSLKVRSVRLLQRLFPGAERLLELGPGTGWETIPMLESGHEVVAVDVSPSMIAVLRSKAVSRGLDAKLSTRVGNAADLDLVLADLPGGTFSGGYATFGVLNLEERLDRIAAGLSHHIAPGGRFVAGVLNRFALGPVIYHLLNGRPRDALGRWRRRRSVRGHVVGALNVFARSISSYAQIFRVGFELESIHPVSFLWPPYRAPHLYQILGARGFQRLDRFDRRGADSFLGPLFSDWDLLVFRRFADEKIHQVYATGTG